MTTPSSRRIAATIAVILLAITACPHPYAEATDKATPAILPQPRGSETGVVAESSKPVRSSPTPAIAPTATSAARAPLPESKAKTLRAELEAMGVTDQAQRKKLSEVEKEFGQQSEQMRDLWKAQAESDLANIQRLESIIAEYGWPLRSVVGDQAATAAFLILQHTDLQRQKKYLPLARAAAKANEMRGSQLALLEDRILLREGGKQIYGSQVQRNPAGAWEALPIEDEANVDKRRAAVGLPPLAVYLQGFAERRGGKSAESKGRPPSPSAPALTQTLFGHQDDDRTARDKLIAIQFSKGEAALELQRGCRDFCLRFPDSPLYSVVRLHAAQNWPMLKATETDRLSPWNALDGEQDPKLDFEARAVIAYDAVQTLAYQAAAAKGVHPDDVLLDGCESRLSTYSGSPGFRQRLLRRACFLPPERTVALLRKHWPEDMEAKRCIDFLNTIGHPFTLEFTALDGRQVDTRSYAGKVVLVHFWSCHLQNHNPFLERLKGFLDRIGENNLAIVGISLDGNKEPVEDTLRALGISWPHYQDGRGYLSPLAERFAINILPCALLVDRQGRLRTRLVDSHSKRLEDQIAALLSEPAPAISGGPAPGSP